MKGLVSMINKNDDIIQHNRPTLGEEEYLATQRVIKSQWVAQGNEVEKFENEICGYVGLPEGHAVALSSCTAAIYLALYLLGANNKNVAYPAYTCSAIRNAVHLVGGIEEVIDSELDTPNIDIDSLNKREAEFAIVPHMYGLPVDISGVSKKITIIEDCAQAIGAKINGKHVGIQGQAGVFSFYASKLITSGGQGGMVVSKDKSLIDAVRDYRDFDQKIDDIRRFNFQMTDLQASIGRIQLSRIKQFINRRNEIFEMYRDAGITLLSGNEESVRYRAIMLSTSVKNKINCLREKGIKVINPLEDWELLGRSDGFSNAFSWTQKTISLPVYPTLDDKQVKRVIFEVKNL